MKLPPNTVSSIEATRHSANALSAIPGPSCPNLHSGRLDFLL